jgi:nucleoside-diphosphate-sugar epimerase
MREGFQMKCVLVTGATGFVGSRVCEWLVEAGYRVKAAVRSASSGLPRLRLAMTEGRGDLVILGDLETLSMNSTAFEDVDCVIHCAGRAHVMVEKAVDPLQAFRAVNVEGTQRLAQLAAQAGVKQFIFLSSIKVNGEKTTDAPFRTEDVSAYSKPSGFRVGTEPRATFVAELVHEDCDDGESNAPERLREKSRPQDPYAQSKWEAEQWLQDYLSPLGISLIIIRPALIYGTGVKGNFERLCRWVQKGIPLPLAGISNHRSLLSLDNLCGLMVAAIEHPEVSGTFVAADRDALSTPQLIRAIAEAFGKTPRLFYCPSFFLYFICLITNKKSTFARLSDSLVVDATGTEKILGWTPENMLERELKRIYKSIELKIPPTPL